MAERRRWCHLEVSLRRRRLKFLVGEAAPTDPLWHELRCFHGDCRTGGCTETCGWSWHTERSFSSTLPWSVSGKLQLVFLSSLDWRSLQNRPVSPSRPVRKLRLPQVKMTVQTPPSSTILSGVKYRKTPSFPRNVPTSTALFGSFVFAARVC